MNKKYLFALAFPLLTLCTVLANVSALDLKLGLNKSNNFKITLWAGSKLIKSPVAMDIDAKGRVWVIEGEGRGKDGIIVLEDTNNDGKADKRIVFYKDSTFRIPMGIAVFDNVIIVSHTPNLIKFTDVNRNGIFDKGIDKKEILLKGFKGKNHDHSLHAVVPSPSGRYYFSYGNKGASIKGKDGRHIISGSYYGNARDAKKKSSDDHLYIGGLTLRMNPDTTKLSVVAENLRNTHDMSVNSFGDVFHADNDDPSHARVSWVPQYANYGYADLNDGLKSWEEVSKTWSEKKIKKTRGDARFNTTHWRMNYPTTTPPDYILGVGAPTGTYFIETHHLGKDFFGTFLVCETVRKTVLAFKPKIQKDHIKMNLRGEFFGLLPNKKKAPLLITDIISSLDGSLFISDWHTTRNRRGQTIRGKGGIYRINKKNESKVNLPKIDYSSKKGLFRALKSPVNSVRFTALSKLKKDKTLTFKELVQQYKQADNIYHKARLIWLAAYLNDKGKKAVEKTLKSNSNISLRLTALRALLYFDKPNLLKYLEIASNDSSLLIKREVLTYLRDISFAQSKHLLTKLIKEYDGESKWYLNAISVASKKKEVQVYDQILKPKFSKKPHSKWSSYERNLAWVLHTKNSLKDLQKVLQNPQLPLDEFRNLSLGFTYYKNNVQRLARQKDLKSLLQFKNLGEKKLSSLEEIIEKDLNSPPAVDLNQSYLVPRSFGIETKTDSADIIAKLKPNLRNGKIKTAICLTCHKIGSSGINFGPNLTDWGKQRPITEIIYDIIKPSKKIAHGYENARIITRGKHKAEGIQTNYSYHAGTLKLKVFGGKYIKLKFRYQNPPTKIQKLKNHSWMPSASKMGLTNQDVRDIAEYLKRGLN